MQTTHTRFGSGQSVRRIEDDKLLLGQGQYADDVQDDPAFAGHLRAFFVRSPYPHARIVAVDKSAALAMPGVVAVYSGADMVAAGAKPIPGTAGFPRTGGAPGATPPRHCLAHERTRFVGEAIAVVVADTLQQARDGATADHLAAPEAAGAGGAASAVSFTSTSRR